MRPVAVFMLVLLVVTAGFCTGAWAQRLPQATILSLKGDVRVRQASSNGWLKAHRNQPLFLGDVVQTSQWGTATVGTRGGSRIQITPLSRLAIGEPRPGPAKGSFLRLLAGKLVILVVGSYPQEIGTAGAIAGARGTRFTLEADEAGHTTVTVLEGVVQFYNDLGSVLVRSGEQSIAAPGVAPSRPARVDPTSYIEIEATLDVLWLNYEKLYNPGASRESLQASAVAAAAATAAAPQESAAWVRYADLLHDLNDLTAADAAYTRALQLTPLAPQLHLKYAYNLLQQGRPEEAAQAFSKSPGAAGVAGQALALAASGTPAKLSEARGLVTQAVAMAPTDPDVLAAAATLALRAGDVPAAQSALAASGDYRAEAYRALLLLAQNQGAEALAAARQATVLAPASGLAHQALTSAEFFVGNLDEARKESRLALALNPLSANAHLLAADVAIASGDLDAALGAAEMALVLDPQLVRAQVTVGLIALSQNDLLRAEKAFNKALTLQPNLPTAQTGLGQTYARQGKLTAALQTQETAVALDANQASIRNNLGAAYLQSGRFNEAIAQFKAALELQPGWALVHSNLALAYLESNRFADAAREGELAVKLGECSPRVYTTLARVYLRQDRVNQAWATLREALEIDPRFAPARLHLAEVYTRLGRPNEALREQAVALSQQPGAMVDNRAYARTEAAVAVGEGSVEALKTQGRGDHGQNAYYLAVEHEQSDWARPHTDINRTNIVALAGRQTAPHETAVLMGSLQNDRRDMPGHEIGGLPEDPNYGAHFRGAEFHVLARQGIWGNGDLTSKFSYRSIRQRDYNPDALIAADPKPFLQLSLEAQGPLAEFRLDKPLGEQNTLTAGLAGSMQRREVSGLIGTINPAPEPPTFSPFSNSMTRKALSGYLEYERVLDARTRLLVGGRVAATDDTTPVWRPKVSLRRDLSPAASLVFLSRPLLADDVSEMSPVEMWALRPFMSPLDLARGGWSQSYELQYERHPQNGSMLRVGLFRRDFCNLLVDLQEPALAPEEAPVVVASASTQGVEFEWERRLTPTLTSGLWVRYTASNNEEAGGDLPYTPQLLGQARLDYMDSAGWRLGAVWTQIGRRYADLANGTRLPSYGLLSLTGARQCNLHTDVFVSVENALNKNFEFYQDYAGRERRVMGGLRYRF